MAGVRMKSVIGAIAASAMFVSSTSAVASTGRTAVQSISPWATLSVLAGGAPAAAMCGGAAVAAAGQPAPSGCVLPAVDAPPPLPVATEAPPPVAPAGYGFSPLLIGLIAIVAGVGLFFAVKGHSNNEQPPPISPS